MQAFYFPPMGEFLRWKELFPTFNKVALIAVLATVVTSVIFFLATSRDGTKAPRGIRNLAEVIVEFIQKQIIMPTMGPGGMKWTPFLLSLFTFIYLCNVPGILPVFFMPATARMAIPLSLALLVWVLMIGTGLKHQKAGYLTHLVWPPGVPVALKPLIGLIEVVSVLFVRPFSLTVRLMANLLAGHILLVTFALLSQALFEARDTILIPMGILPFFMLMFVVAFEILVAFLQAYIFTILAAVYIGEGRQTAHAH